MRGAEGVQWTYYMNKMSDIQLLETHLQQQIKEVTGDYADAVNRELLVRKIAWNLQDGVTRL